MEHPVVQHLWVCEQEFISLDPEVVYILSVHPACKRCNELASMADFYTPEDYSFRAILTDLLNASHRGIYSAGFTREAVARAENLLTPGMTPEERREIALADNERRISAQEEGL